MCVCVRACVATAALLMFDDKNIADTVRMLTFLILILLRHYLVHIV